MNWIKKTLGIGEKIKRLITKHRPTKEETEKVIGHLVAKVPF